MKLETLSCNNCGAALSVPADANFITCNHCQSALAVRRDQTVTYTSKIDEIDRRTKQMAEDIAQLRDRAEVVRQDGNPDQETSAVTSVAGRAVGVIMGLGFCIVAVVFGSTFATSSHEAGAPAMFPVFGVFFAIMGVLAGIGIIVAAATRKSGSADKRY